MGRGKPLEFSCRRACFPSALSLRNLPAKSPHLSGRYAALHGDFCFAGLALFHQIQRMPAETSRSCSVIRHAAQAMCVAGVLFAAAASVSAQQQPAKVSKAISPTPVLAPKAVLSQKLAENLLRYLPKTTAALRARAGNVAVSVVGDGVAGYWQPELDDRYHMECSWHGHFLMRLANTFIYSGGVQYSGSSLSASKKRRQESKNEAATTSLPGDIPEPLAPLVGASSGPSIQAEMFTRDHGSAVQAFQWLTTSAFDAQPTLVILQYGFADGQAGLSLGHFKNIMTEAVKLCKQRGVDVILAGPPLAVGRSILRMGVTRSYSDALRQIGEAEGVLFADFGAAQVDLAHEENGSEGVAYRGVLEHLRSQYDLLTPGEETVPSMLGHKIFADAVWRQIEFGSPLRDLAPLGSTDTNSAAAAVPAASVSQPISATGKLLELPISPGGPTQASLAVKFTTSAAQNSSLQYQLLTVDRSWRPAEQAPPPAESPADGANLVVYADAVGQADVGPGAAADRLLLLKAPEVPQPLLDVRLDVPFAERGTTLASMLLFHGGRVSLLDFPVTLSPAFIELPINRFEGLTGAIQLTIRAACEPGNSGRAKFRLHWMGHEEEIPVSLAETPQNFTLRLPLPPAGEPVVHLKRELKIDLETAKGRITCTREVEITRHLPLERKLLLTPRPLQHSREDAWLAKEDPLGPALTVLADRSGLYFVMDLPPTQGTRGNTGASAKVTFTLDARGPQSRGRIGFVDPIEMDVPWEDGRFEVDRPRDAIFGNGYDRELEKKWFLASVTTLATGRRQVRLSVPRWYFYLHEWSLGKTDQNTLGLNTTVSLADVDAVSGKVTYPASRVFSIVSPGLSRHDALGLAVLELDAAAPVRWSAVVY